jgi:hypothetical protein
MTAAPHLCDTWTNSHPPAGLTKRLRKHNLKERTFSEKQRFCNLKDVTKRRLINVGFEVLCVPGFDTHFMYNGHHKGRGSSIPLFTVHIVLFGR